MVKEHDIANTLRLVPEKFAKAADRETVELRIDKKKFEKMKHFIQEDYIPPNITLYMAEQEGWYAGIPAAMFVEREAIPAGGVAVHKGAKDEHVGKTDEFLVEGHLWGKKDMWYRSNRLIVTKTPMYA